MSMPISSSPRANLQSRAADAPAPDTSPVVETQEAASVETVASKPSEEGAAFAVLCRAASLALEMAAKALYRAPPPLPQATASSEPSSAAPQMGAGPTTSAANVPAKIDTGGAGAKGPAMTARELSPVQGKLTGGALHITDNPESFSTPGVLGSTIAGIPGRGDNRHTFNGSAQTFSLAQNRTGVPQRFSNVFHNQSDQPATVKVKGTVYMPTVTTVDGAIPPTYKKDGGFRGPQAIASSSLASGVNGKNGYFEKTIVVPPGKSISLTDTYHPPGAEVFSRLEIEAKSASGAAVPFSLATVSSPKSLASGDFAKIEKGEMAAAGKPENFAPARAEKGELGRPNGVIVDGGTFVGGRSIDVGTTAKTGDLFMATRFKNAGSTTEIGKLSKVPGNLDGTPAAKTDEGNYGVKYKLSYPLHNSSDRPQRVDIRLTAPHTTGSKHHPVGGEMTTAVKVNGVVIPARVDQRGEGTLLGTVVIPPGATQDVNFEMTNFGNNFPPGGLEFVVR
jgi:hypothetical protein